MDILNQLALSPFEWTMSDKVSASPMEFVVRLDCVGNVDATKFTEAISAELKRQPLLQANATVGETHRDSYWRPASNCTPKIHWYDENPDQGSGFPKDFAPIDLESEIGCRFYGWRFLANDRECVVLKFVYHHACCDGKGSIAFAENTLHRYQCLLDQNATLVGDLKVVDPQQLLNRNSPTTNKLGTIDRVWRALLIRPKRVGNMLLSKPRLLSRSARVANGGDVDLYSNPPRHCSTELSVDETKRLGVLAKKLSASSNTILARELFHVLNDHFEDDLNLADDGNAETSDARAKSNRALRILIPFSLRDETHNKMPAANCVSMAYLEARQEILSEDSSNNPVLVSELVEQVSFIRRWNLQYSWIESIESFAKIWPIVKLFKFRKASPTKKAPIATTVMTNLGRVFRGSGLVDNEGTLAVNGMVVNSFHLILPCTATTMVNFSVNFYGNRLTLDAAYLPSLQDRETVETLLHSWKQRILDSVAGLQIAG